MGKAAFWEGLPLGLYREEKNKFSFGVILLSAEAAAFALFWITTLDPVVLKFCLVLFPFVYSLGALRFRSVSGFITQFALGLTLAADCVLLFDSFRLLPALILFCGAQFLYLVRIGIESGARSTVLFLFLRASILGAALGPIAFWNGAASPAPYLAAVYGALLIPNVLQAFFTRRAKALSFGLLLFLFCDAFVLLTVLCELPSAAFPPSVTRALRAIPFAWIFYPPSQTLLALSAPRSTKSE